MLHKSCTITYMSSALNILYDLSLTYLSSFDMLYTLLTRIILNKSTVYLLLYRFDISYSLLNNPTTIFLSHDYMKYNSLSI